MTAARWVTPAGWRARPAAARGRTAAAAEVWQSRFVVIKWHILCFPGAAPSGPSYVVIR